MFTVGNYQSPIHSIANLRIRMIVLTRTEAEYRVQRGGSVAKAIVGNCELRGFAAGQYLCRHVGTNTTLLRTRIR